MLSPDSQSPGTTRINPIKVKRMIMNPIKAPTIRAQFSQMLRMMMKTGHANAKEQEIKNPKHKATVNYLKIRILEILEAPFLAPAEP